jgi:threonine synthase
VSAFIGLQCHLCKATFPAEATYVCEKCLGPLEPIYDYAAIALTRDQIERRPKNMWRYRELLPIAGDPQTGFHSGFTPLVRCTRLAERLGLKELYIKDDSVNHPTLSYKDRVVSVAATRAKELGFEVLACASTGNLANSVAAHAARLGMECCVFIPDTLEAGKVLGSAIFGPTILAINGNYDDVNRLCTQVADRYGWGFVNINLRSYYAEGAKTLGFEVVEQLGWRFPQHAAPAHRARLPRAEADWAGRRRAAEDSRGAGLRLLAGRQRHSRRS